MTTTQEYKTRLEEEKRSLEAQLATIAQPDPQNPQEWVAVQTETAQEPDPNDRADHQDEYQENRALVEELNPRYQDVLAALARVDAGTYGTCEVCGKEIETDRLEADPAARTCKEHLS